MSTFTRSVTPLLSISIMNANISAGIAHAVYFKLKISPTSTEAAAFFQAAKELAAIEGVRDLKILKQISAQNNFDFGISMHFDSTQDYNAYNDNLQHLAFVNDYWMKYVEDFIEIDSTQII